MEIISSAPVRRGIVAFVAACGLLGTVDALAQKAPSYAVLSLMGDKITLVTRKGTIGSHLDRNVRDEIAIQDDTFDASALRTAGEAIARAQPGATASLFSTRDPKLFALQEKLVDSETDSTELAESLKELLAQAKASHLLLITKYRAEANLKLADSSVGNGKILGIGFYIDHTRETIAVETGVTSQGLFAPYAYLKFTLIDAATLKTVRKWTTTESHIYTPGESGNVPWTVLSSAQKVAALQRVIEIAVEGAIPRVLATP